MGLREGISVFQNFVFLNRSFFTKSFQWQQNASNCYIWDFKQTSWFGFACKTLAKFSVFFLPLALVACKKMENRDEYINGEFLSYSHKLFCFFSYSLFPRL